MLIAILSFPGQGESSGQQEKLSLLTQAEMGCRTVGHQTHETSTRQSIAVLSNHTAHFCCTQGSHRLSHPGSPIPRPTQPARPQGRDVMAAGCSGEHSRGGRMLEVCSGLCSHGTAEAQPSHSQTHSLMSDKSLSGHPNQRDWQQSPATLNAFQHLWMLEVW